MKKKGKGVIAKTRVSFLIRDVEGTPSLFVSFQQKCMHVVWLCFELGVGPSAFVASPALILPLHPCLIWYSR